MGETRRFLSFATLKRDPGRGRLRSIFIHPPFRHKAPLMFEPGHELGLTLVLRFGSVFFRPSPRQTSLEPRRCEIEECVKLNRQEPAGRINEADR